MDAVIIVGVRLLQSKAVDVVSPVVAFKVKVVAFAPTTLARSVSFIMYL